MHAAGEGAGGAKRGQVGRGGGGQCHQPPGGSLLMSAISINYHNDSPQQPSYESSSDLGIESGTEVEDSLSEK